MAQVLARATSRIVLLGIATVFSVSSLVLAQETFPSIKIDQLRSQHQHVAIVSISDDTLEAYKAVLPIDPVLLAKLVDAVDATGAKVIGINTLFTRTLPSDNEGILVEAIKRARTKVVLAADARLGLARSKIERQASLIAQTGRPAGYANLATGPDGIVKFKVQPLPESAYGKSFARLLAESAGYSPDETRQRIAWLREPRDGSDTFLTIPAEILLRSPGDRVSESLRAALKGKIVIIGGLLSDIDVHLTPVGNMHGTLIHAQVVAELVDGRGI